VRALVLGGTGEARELAVRLTDLGIEVTSSLAGRVTRPELPLGEVRIGGFGGAAGLRAYLRATNPSVVVDATHPFARTITQHAVQVCGETSTPLLVLRRPGWTAGPDDDWIRLPSIDAAAAYVRASAPGTVFLTTGRHDLAAFADDDSHEFVVRSVDPPEGRIPPRMTLVLDRGPYLLESELALMRAHHVRLLVTKDSGGPLTIAKLAAARQLAVPVAVVDRPPLPKGVTTLDDVDAVLSRLPAWA
jgi:precorrin-6A/cobalt-precorrin-6A reductase